MLRQFIASFGVLGTLAVLLGACAVVDQYSGRAVVYNLQAEQAQEQALLLNIVRASLRRPMQFTGLQSITGTASASASIGPSGSSTKNDPFVSAFHLIPPSSSTIISGVVTNTLGGSASVSGGPTFSVPVLDTQEFYRGFLTPVSGQLLDLYLQYGYPRDVLFNVTIEKIIIKRLDGECGPEVHLPQCEITIRNYVPEDVSLELFQGILGYLIRLGLNTEPIAAASEKSQKSAADTQSDAPRPFGFCFSPKDPATYREINRHVLCGHPAASLELKASEIGRRSLITGVPLRKAFVDQLYLESVAPRLEGEEADVRAKGFRDLRAFGGKRVSISFYTRSIEGILYYLGEIVRRSTHPEPGQSVRRVQVRVGPPQNPFPLKSCPFEGTIDGYRCTDLFVVEEGGIDPNGISVDYGGVSYSISSNTSGSWTMPVFDVVKQLQAVNTSAKQLPASNLISVLSNN
ncbi:MAG: hypothetical protein JO314_01895 [Acidobacteria bacterium]|nr:hypothetical protein [Acidobacteriota bacterium]